MNKKSDLVKGQSLLSYRWGKKDWNIAKKQISLHILIFQTAEIPKQSAGLSVQASSPPKTPFLAWNQTWGISGFQENSVFFSAY